MNRDAPLELTFAINLLGWCAIVTLEAIRPGLVADALNLHWLVLGSVVVTLAAYAAGSFQATSRSDPSDGSNVTNR